MKIRIRIGVTRSELVVERPTLKDDLVLGLLARAARLVDLVGRRRGVLGHEALAQPDRQPARVHRPHETE